jgi:hypothetical protein
VSWDAMSNAESMDDEGAAEPEPAQA